MRSGIFILLLFLFSFVIAQEKNDSMFYFYSFKEDLNKYEPDFDRKIKNDSVVFYTLDSLKAIGFYTLRLDSIRDNRIYINKGKMHKRIWVKNDSLFNASTDLFPIYDTDSLVNKITSDYAEKGYPFTEVKIIPEGYKDEEVMVRVELNLFGQRTINAVVSEGYEKLSKGYIKHDLGLKIGKTYNESELKEISERMAFNPFIEEIRPAQTLFNTDSTTVFLYVKKEKSNYFDGILGFGNDANGDFQLNGNVKVELNNNFNGMEKISLNWIATPDKSTSLDLNVKVPYLFRSAVGSSTRLNIHKKDSVYVNTKIDERLFYQLNRNSSLGLDLTYESSNFVLEDHPELAMLYDDFNKTGIGLSYEFTRPSKNRLLEGITGINLSGKTLERTIEEFDSELMIWNQTKSNQYEIGISLFHLIRINPRNYIRGKLEFYSLFGDKDSYIQNELYRIGGFNSIRGFNEESIFASTYGIGSLEYRFMPNEGFYISVFGDYARIENKVTYITENFLGLGTGISFLTGMGVFNISYAAGKQSEGGFDFKNSKIHFGILAQF